MQDLLFKFSDVISSDTTDVGRTQLVRHQINTRFILDTNASDDGLGAVLSQVIKGNERVIAFASRVLTK